MFTLREYIMLNTKQKMSGTQFYYYCKNLHYIEKGYDKDDFDPFALPNKKDEKGIKI